MKLFTKRILQRTFGLHWYMLIHSLFVLLTLRFYSGENGVLQFLRRIPKNGTIIDAGANVGSMTALFAWHCSEGKVYAYEPIPAFVKVVRAIVHFFNLRNVIVRPVGLLDRCDQLEMVVPIEQGAIQEGLAHLVEDQDFRRDAGSHCMVPCVNIDSEKIAEHVYGIKIDIEGAELKALIGASALIARDHPIIYAELWNNIDKITLFLQQYGYILCNSSGLPIRDGEPIPGNVLFLPQGA